MPIVWTCVFSVKAFHIAIFSAVIFNITLEFSREGSDEDEDSKYISNKNMFLLTPYSSGKGRCLLGGRG